MLLDVEASFVFLLCETGESIVIDEIPDEYWTSLKQPILRFSHRMVCKVGQCREISTCSDARAWQSVGSRLQIAQRGVLDIRSAMVGSPTTHQQIIRLGRTGVPVREKTAILCNQLLGQAEQRRFKVLHFAVRNKLEREQILSVWRGNSLVKSTETFCNAIAHC